MKLCFSIRDLLWLTVVVALAVAWWIDHSRIAELSARLDAAEHLRDVYGIEAANLRADLAKVLSAPSHIAGPVESIGPVPESPKAGE